MLVGADPCHHRQDKARVLQMRPQASCLVNNFHLLSLPQRRARDSNPREWLALLVFGTSAISL